MLKSHERANAFNLVCFVPYLTISNSSGAGPGRIWETENGENLFLDHKANVVNNAVSCYKDAIQFSSCSVMSLRHCLPVFDKICGTAVNIVFFAWVTLIKIENTPLDRSAALVCKEKMKCHLQTEQ